MCGRGAGAREAGATLRGRWARVKPPASPKCIFVFRPLRALRGFRLLGYCFSAFFVVGGPVRSRMRAYEDVAFSMLRSWFPCEGFVFNMGCVDR